tara:strand:+ start:759 stop:965 length:207 start_codon:yes stop_codon:yes gene_type:complete
MDNLSCKTCRGTGFVKRTKKEYCSNNPYHISSHYCYKCENIQEKLKGKYVLCEKCNGDGYLKLPKSSS